MRTYANRDATADLPWGEPLAQPLFCVSHGDKENRAKRRLIHVNLGSARSANVRLLDAMCDHRALLCGKAPQRDHRWVAR